MTSRTSRPTRRIVLATLATGLLVGGTATPLIGSASVTSAAGYDEVKSVCVVVFSDPNKPQRDGVCVHTPNLPF